MQLQTHIPLKPEEPSIDYDSKVLLVGSCFSENIGAKLEYVKFQNKQNPFGVIFNPISIEKLIDRSIRQKYFTEDDLFEHNGLWHCYDVHSRFSTSNKTEVISKLNAALEGLHFYIYNSSHMIITLGSAWVYRLKTSNEIVANCHKIPQSAFSKELLSGQTISECLRRIAAAIQQINKNTTLIFTVSPVRHLKDGFVENTHSKSVLISGIHNALASTERTHYFPSYELMMDELRDYRFYTEDMIHPNETAIQYIWERFKLVWISEATLPLQHEIASIQRGLQHRPFHPDSESHKKFEAKLEERMLRLKEQFQHITFMT